MDQGKSRSAEKAKEMTEIAETPIEFPSAPSGLRLLLPENDIRTIIDVLVIRNVKSDYMEIMKNMWKIARPLIFAQSGFQNMPPANVIEVIEGMMEAIIHGLSDKSLGIAVYFNISTNVIERWEVVRDEHESNAIPITIAISEASQLTISAGNGSGALGDRGMDRNGQNNMDKAIN